jgi:hypothetical protein
MNGERLIPRRAASVKTVVFVSLALLFSAGCVTTSVPPKPVSDSAEVTGPESADEASAYLLERLRLDHAYPSIPSRCLTTEFEGSDDDSYDFALRYNQAICGGESPSTLLDRFRVFQRSDVILYYTAAGPKYLSYEWFLKHRAR